MSTTVEFDGLHEFAALLKKLAAASGGFDDMSRAVAPIIYAHVMECFDESKAPDGTPWETLRYRAGQPLHNTGTLMHSIRVYAEGADVVMSTNLTVEWKGTVHALGAIHQYGATVKPRPDNIYGLLFFPGPDGKMIAAKQVEIPARPFFPTEGLPEEWAQDAQEAIATRLAHHLKERGASAL